MLELRHLERLFRRWIAIFAWIFLQCGENIQIFVNARYVDWWSGVGSYHRWEGIASDHFAFAEWFSKLNQTIEKTRQLRHSIRLTQAFSHLGNEIENIFQKRCEFCIHSVGSWSKKWNLKFSWNNTSMTYIFRQSILCWSISRRLDKWPVISMANPSTKQCCLAVDQAVVKWPSAERTKSVREFVRIVPIMRPPPLWALAGSAVRTIFRKQRSNQQVLPQRFDTLGPIHFFVADQNAQFSRNNFFDRVLVVCQNRLKLYYLWVDMTAFRSQ